jgi:hypothetical protein
MSLQVVGIGVDVEETGIMLSIHNVLTAIGICYTYELHVVW